MLFSSYSSDFPEAGCDEAGRGCLAGPVFAAAVILPAGFDHPLLKDSKALNHREREFIRPVIEREALAWAVSSVSQEIIDKINILNASILAMHQAIDQLKPRPVHLIIDGNRFKPYQDIAHACIVKGDAKYKSIAAASILAKTHRDAYMTEISRHFPIYHWEKNKGYPTEEHREAIAIHGLTPHHRKTFRSAVQGPEFLL